MADAPEETEAGAEEPSGGGGLKWIIIAVVATIVLGGGGAAAWYFFLRGDGKAEVAKKAKKEAGPESPLVGPMISLKTFIVNLADPGGRRYLKVKLELELENKETEMELKARLPEVKDQIILALSSKTYQQIQGVAGKTVLREELTARANSVLKSGKVRKAFFTEFVVQ
ncbi:flagellar basal body-associated protein FliL [Nitrospinota bacterium]